MTFSSRLPSIIALIAVANASPASVAFITHGSRSICRLPTTAVHYQSEKEAPTEKLNGSFQPTSNKLSSALPEVFKGVSLPPGQEPEAIPNEFTQEQVGAYVAKAAANFALIGKPKTTLYGPRSIVRDQANLGASLPSPEDYKFFGNGKHETTLELLLRTNPFFASALTETRYGYQLKSFDPKEKNPSIFLQMMRTLNGVGHRVNVNFHRNMKIRSIIVYDDMEGKPVRGPLDSNKYASSAIYNVFFYASCVHATIHVLHYLMTAAFQEASKDFPEMNQWATSYARNIAQKYGQVGALLIKDPPPLGTPADPTPILDTALITGTDGFGSSQAIRPILKDLLDMWGQNPTAEKWLENMMGMSSSKMARDGILNEFTKHFTLIKPFAKDTSNALSEINPEKFAAAEEKLKTYLKSCGEFKSNIDTFDQWLELMSVTGMVHGATLSYTRMFGDAEIARWRNIQNPNWDFADINLITGGLGTVVGMQSGRHVMTSETNSGDKFAPALQEVLDTYDDKTSALKEEYKEELLKYRGFNEYGWILSDYCPDDFDGKQLTIATYI